MYSNVLVPISFDETRNSEAALKTAAFLAGDGGKVTAIHVIEDVPNFAEAYVPADVSQQAAAAAKESFAKLVPDASIPRSILHGSPGTVILEHAKEIGADCIVIASHKPGLSDYFLGSTAARVVRHAKCCVHVIR